MSSPNEVRIGTVMREAFLGADIRSASPATLRLVAKPLVGGVGNVRRRKLWNKSFAPEPTLTPSV